uniref:Uncharacterized protein n=1 Tax=Anguilla anguilla TaxID=7936 RepID=A0A0E9RUU5_ANGAN
MFVQSLSFCRLKNYFPCVHLNPHQTEPKGGLHSLKIFWVWPEHPFQMKGQSYKPCKFVFAVILAAITLP